MYFAQSVVDSLDDLCVDGWGPDLRFHAVLHEHGGQVAHTLPQAVCVARLHSAPTSPAAHTHACSIHPADTRISLKHTQYVGWISVY